jgi:hypothetical protein
MVLPPYREGMLLPDMSRFQEFFTKFLQREAKLRLGLASRVKISNS